jgi:hypothetical protein
MYVFGNRRTPQGKQECHKCKKMFKNSDYMEYHMKLQHFQNQRLQATQVCLSDFCDIFECTEEEDKMLKHQVFMNRDYNYEEKSSTAQY